MTSKIKIKAGLIEVEFEGSEEYMKEQLPSLVELLCSIAPDPTENSEGEKDELFVAPTNSKSKLQLTTNTIAAKLNVKTGSELILAACAHLTFVKGADTFKRSNISAEMKLASNYYKENFHKNLSSSLKTLVANGKLLETASDTYALSASTKSTLESSLN